MHELNFAVHGETFPLRLEDSADGYQIMLGERSYRVQLQHEGNGELRLLIDGQPSHFYFAAHPSETGQLLIWHKGQSWQIDAIDSQLARKSKRQDASDQPISATMPGVVHSILVNVGDLIVAGDTLLILEAMKMEMRINARSAGKVGKIHCKVGDVVNRGQELIEMESVEE